MRKLKDDPTLEHGGDFKLLAPIANLRSSQRKVNNPTNLCLFSFLRFLQLSLSVCYILKKIIYHKMT